MAACYANPSGVTRSANIRVALQAISRRVDGENKIVLETTSKQPRPMVLDTRRQPRSVGEFISRHLHKENSLGYILLSPGFIFLLVMLAYPFVYAVYLSFT